MKLGCLVAAAVLLLAAATTPGIAATNDPPLADAGLDQSVTRGTTVYLDAGGSIDPDGGITDYWWTITTPTDTTRTPDCADCEQTQFTPNTVGTYEVTLSVTDDDGNSATDTLYVTVNPGEPPSVSLAGPARLNVGEPGTFTTTIDAGDASLDTALWYVDGERRETTAIDGDAATASHETLFPDSGTYDVKIVATDTDGQQASATKTVTVTTETGPETTDGTSSTETDPETTVGTSPTERFTSDILGPRVITGSGQLTGLYELSDGSSGIWRLDERRVGTGKSVTLDLEPGVHTLYAASTGDSSGIAEFPDGSRSVVADPAPELTVEEVGNESVPTVDAYATDDLGNLESLTVFVDGEAVSTVTRSGMDYSASGGDKLSIVERLGSLEPGEHVVRVRATDSRGQTDSFETTVGVPGPPEVVSAGFVNEGPLDQYHPRINESRYTATYEVVIDLNGVEPEAVQTDIALQEIDETTSQNNIINNKYTIQKSGFRKEIKDIQAESEILWRNGEYSHYSRDLIPVSPAPPEIRLEVIAPQTAEESARRGMKLDASESFDPDKTNLDFEWFGVQGDYRETSWASLNSWDIGRLVISDGNGQESKTSEPISWFAPSVSDVAIKSNGPYYPDENVTISVVSERYYLSKPFYKRLTSFDLRASSGRVSNHSIENEKPGDVDDAEPEALAKWHRWSVEIPASEFTDSSLTVATYPTEHPQVEYSEDIPDVEVYVKTGSELRNVSTKVMYRVERPEYSTRQTTTADVRESLLSAGYEIHRVSDEGHKYEIEERVKVADAKYETKEQKFEKRVHRGDFLKMNPGWSDAGVTQETKIETTTATEWRSARRGDGTFTGKTRQALIEQAVTRTEKQFRYESTVTFQEEVTYQDTVTRSYSYVEYEERCTSFGCHMYGKTVTETQHYTVTRTRSVTRTRTNVQTYWSTRSRSPTHEYTGQRRTVTVEPAEYEQQYQYEFEKEQTEVERTFVAEKRVEVSPAEYEWQHRNTIHNQLHAETAATADNVRIADVTTTTQWALKKQTDSEIGIVSEPRLDWKVLGTLGTGEATLVRYYVDREADRIRTTKERTTQLRVTHEEAGLISKGKIKNILREKMGGRE